MSQYRAAFNGLCLWREINKNDPLLIPKHVRVCVAERKAGNSYRRWCRRRGRLTRRLIEFVYENGVRGSLISRTSIRYTADVIQTYARESGCWGRTVNAVTVLCSTGRSSLVSLIRTLAQYRFFSRPGNDSCALCKDRREFIIFFFFFLLHIFLYHFAFFYLVVGFSSFFFFFLLYARVFVATTTTTKYTLCSMVFRRGKTVYRSYLVRVRRYDIRSDLLR